MREPWLGDACSLVEALRRGELSPLEAFEASVAAIEHSSLNAFSHLDLDAAAKAAAEADVSLPFGGVPIGVKELERVAGWPFPRGSLALKDDVSDIDSTHVTRQRHAGAVLVGQTCAPEFGASLQTSTKIHGVTRSPWDPECSPGGSSGGSAAAVAGGLVPIASAGDGGGSTRVPAAFCGLVGLKTTFGRIPRGPRYPQGMFHTVVGCVSRSVRDTARWLDVTNGHDPRDPFSLPRVEGFEAGLGGDLRGRRVAIAPDLGMAVVDSRCADLVANAGEALARAAGLEIVDVPVKLPPNSADWLLSLRPGVFASLGDRYPECEGELTDQVRQLLAATKALYNTDLRARVETHRVEMAEAFADLFEQVDLVVACTSPGTPFAADDPPPTIIDGQDAPLMNAAALTMISNVNGNPAISVPAGTVDGLPVGMQLIARHHDEGLLLDAALVMERETPWPLVAPGAPK